MVAPPMYVLHLLILVAATYGGSIPDPHKANETGVPHEPRALPLPPHPQPIAAPGSKPILPSSAVDSGIPCTKDGNCTTTQMGPDSICHGSHCACNDKSTLSETSGKCLRESLLGSGCDENWQCTRPLGDAVECKNHLCACKSNAAMVNGKCWTQRILSEPCEFNEQCIGGRNSHCVDKRCVCKVGMVPAPSNERCLTAATKFQDPCDESIQCTEPFGDGSVCKNAQCLCQDNFHFLQHVCMKNLNLGDPCGADIKGGCYLLHFLGIDKVECNNTCQCKGDLTPSSDNQKCLEPGQSDDGNGGADSIQPMAITFVTILLAKLFTL